VNQERPLLSVVVGGSTLTGLARTVASMRQQTDPDWELILPAGVTGAVDAVAATADPRVRVAGSPMRDALGSFTTVVDAGGRVLREAVETLRSTLERVPDLAMAWSSERVLAPDGGVEATIRKPSWSPVRLRSLPWTGRLTFLRTDLIHDVDDGVSERELVLRVSEAAHRRVSISEVLYEASPAVDDAVSDKDWDEAVRSVERHLVRTGVDARVERGRLPGSTRLRYAVPPDLSVSVVIASGAESGLAWGERRRWAVGAVDSVLRSAGHGALEVVLVVPVGSRSRLVEELGHRSEQVRVVEHGAGLDVPAMLNVGTVLSVGEVVVLLDERTEVPDDGFVRAVVGPLLAPGTGITGARVLTERTTHEGAGIGLADRRFRAVQRGATDTDPGPQGLLEVTRESTTLGPGAIALRRATFDEVGGVSEQLPTRWSWDLGLKVRHLGLTCVWVADARIYHLPDRREVSRKERDQETQVLRKRWRGRETDAFVPEIGALAVARAAAAAGQSQGAASRS
jgi:hypothetical protein